MVLLCAGAGYRGEEILFGNYPVAAASLVLMLEPGKGTAWSPRVCLSFPAQTGTLPATPPSLLLLTTPLGKGKKNIPQVLGPGGSHSGCLLDLIFTGFPSKCERRGTFLTSRKQNAHVPGLRRVQPPSQRRKVLEGGQDTPWSLYERPHHREVVKHPEDDDRAHHADALTGPDL